MVRTAVWVLRQRRYARLAALMVVIAAGCVAAGTWQISRYEQTARTNRVLKANAHAAVVALPTLGVPLVGDGPAPGREAIRYRTVAVSGTYLAGGQEFLRDQSVEGRSGFDVVDPLRTARGVLMVVRGFVVGAGDATMPPAVPGPPSGEQTVVGRLQTADTGSDDAAELGHGVIDAVNPGQQAARLGAPVFAAYLTLTGRQPGLSALPAPDLSNPAGGAVEPQHLAYIVQWYLFALLALAAPFAIARSEVRDAQRRFLGADPDGGDFDAEPASVSLASSAPQLAVGASAQPAEGVVAVRAGGALAHRDADEARRWERAERLASRYGRSLSTGSTSSSEPVLAPVERVGPARREPGYALGNPVANSADRPHRSPDAYHGSYNDYLWRLAMADGDIPQVSPAAAPDPTPTPAAPPRIIEADGRPVGAPLEAEGRAVGGPSEADDTPVVDPVDSDDAPPGSA